jgi:predicted metal-dependent hydrolase
MKKRWGSCNKNGLIHLNPELIAAPKSCIDYVIHHELCHLKVYNHSPRFYNLLSKVNPDWQKQKDYLNKNIDVRFV